MLRPRLKIGKFSYLRLFSLMILLFLCIGSYTIIANMHLHISPEGRIHIHSHPNENANSGQSNGNGHSHTYKEYVFLNFIKSLLNNILLIILLLFVLLVIITIYIDKKYFIALHTICLIPYLDRAPPYNALR